MELKWMGRYRKIVEYLNKFGNTYAQNYMVEKSFHTPVTFSALQLQVMEYILENEDKNQSMVEIAMRLGISVSTFSKNVKKMADKGLVEKYHVQGNRKEVIVKTTDYGKEIYEMYAEYILKTVFEPIFRLLDGLSDEALDTFTEVIRLTATMGGEKPPRVSKDQKELIKIE